MACDGVGREADLGREAIVEPGHRGGVPEDAIALGRDHERDGDVGVGLREFDGRSAVVEHAALVLAQSVDGFLNGGVKLVFHAVKVFPVNGGLHVTARLVLELLQQAVTLLVLKFEVAPRRAR